jgi:hypothetical protein
MRGVYTSALKIAGLNAAKTVAYITAPTTKVVEIIGFTLTNESNATNFQFELAIANISSLGTPTATAVTPTPHESGDQAAGSTTKMNVTASEPTYSTTITQEGAASLVGYRHEPAPEERLYVTAATSIGFRMITTPTSFDADARLTFREIG